MEIPPGRLRDAARRAGRDRDASRAAISVLKASARVSQAIERALADVDLTRPQFNVLMELAASPQGVLAQHTMIDRLISTPSNLSWLTTRMSERGLLTKERDGDDGRVVVVGITEAGWAALEEAMPRVFAIEKELWHRHARSERRAVTDLLEPLTEPTPRDGRSDASAPPQRTAGA